VTQTILLVVGGLVLLTLAADRFVVSASRLARHWGMSPLLVGAVVVGMGTSFPELLVSITGGLDSFDLGVGNITGSNIANLTLVLGLAAVIAPIAGTANIVWNEGVLTLAAVTAFSATLWDGTITRWEGAVLLLGMVIALHRFFLLERRKKAEMSAKVAAGTIPQRATETPTGSVRVEVVVAVATLAGMLLGADLLTDGALSLAAEFGLAEGLVGNTLVAVGTSLPEVAAAVAAALRREHDIVLGNLLGSNVFNSLLVAGALGVTTGGSMTTDPLVTILFMVGTVAFAGVLASRGPLSRLGGVILLVTYAGFIWSVV